MPQCSRPDIPIFATIRDPESTRDIVDMNKTKYKEAIREVSRLRQELEGVRSEIEVMSKALPSTVKQGRQMYNGEHIL